MRQRKEFTVEGGVISLTTFGDGNIVIMDRDGDVAWVAREDVKRIANAMLEMINEFEGEGV